jgi:hypothetical protein
MTVSASTFESRPVRVAIDRAAAPQAPELTYVLRTLLRTAGLSWQFEWAESTTGDVDIAYGEVARDRAHVRIPRAPWPLANAPAMDPAGVVPFGALPLLRFAGESPRPLTGGDIIDFPVDVLFGCFWWLTGAREATWRRDKVDNLHLDDHLIRREGLLARPLASLLAEHLRRHFESRGFKPRTPPWANGNKSAAFAFTHDVDYPEIIRWIEVPRILLMRRSPRLAFDVATGRSHFWTFREWVDFTAELGTSPAFYFMARQGSLLQYATGTPDDFYDVGSRRFRDLFAELSDQGCEIGLHASFHAHRSVDQLRNERERIESVAGVSGIGNRHHYWHLDPADPNETLRRHEQAGLSYDSSLGLEFYPGFRRGMCHPFRAYHAGERRELDIVQLPPAWMDDHFDRRLAQNGISDPTVAALALVDAARQTRGTVVVDYHSRGANGAIYPRYGPWLMQFVREQLGSDVHFDTPRSLVDGWRVHAAELEARSSDHVRDDAVMVAAGPALVIRPMQEADIAGTAALHSSLFGNPEVHGHSIGTLGPDILGDVFYRLNLDNRHFACDVALVDGRVAGFSVYATDRTQVFRHPVTAHPIGLVGACLRAVVKRPSVLRALLGNARYLAGEHLPFLDGVSGWWIVAGVAPEYRDRTFERSIGGTPIAARLFDQMEERLRSAACEAWYGVVRPDNEAINRFLLRRGAKPVGMSGAQGLQMRYYVKRFEGDPLP